MKTSDLADSQVAFPKVLFWAGIAALILLVVSSYWTTYTINQTIRNSAATSGMNISEGLANAVAETIITKDYGLMEGVARQTLANTNILSVYIVDANDRILLHLNREMAGREAKLDFSEINIVAPQRRSRKSFYEPNEDFLVFWSSIDRGIHMGWVRVEISRLESEKIISALLLNSLIALFLIFFVVLLFSAWKFRSHLQQIGFLNKKLFAKNAQKEREIISSHLMLMDVLGKMVAKRDSDTGLHNSRVTYIAIRIAEKLEYKPDEMQSLIAGSFLHDIGKIAIPDAILLKPSGLTEEEWMIMKSHVFHGEQLVQNIGWLNIARDVVAGHHEKWDGSGYPRQLSGQNIPMSARIFMVADVFDALCSKRPYKKAFTYEESMEIIHKGANSHFDPHIVAVFSIISREIYDVLFNSTEHDIEKIFKEKIHQFFYKD